MRILALSGVLLSIIILFTSIAAATERHVPSEYATIQAAINACSNGDVVIVAPGTYTGTGNRDIDFKGKAITVRSENGPNSCIINCDGTYEENHRGFYFNSGEGRDSILEGFTIAYGLIVRTCGSGGGIYIDGGASPMISKCNVVHNHVEESGLCFCQGGGIYAGYESNPLITDCIISRNSVGDWGWGGGISCSQMTIHNSIIINNTALGYEGEGGGIDAGGTVVNCTIVNNSTSGVCGGICGPVTVNNSIIWANTGANQIAGVTNINYSDIQGGWPGTGNIDTDPCFAASYYLKSQAGRWNPTTQSWVIDAVTSPCIDAGNPGCPLGNEPNDANNIRINMGAYGGTSQASKTPANWRSIADLTNDWVVDFNDLGVFVSYWLDTDECIPSDLDRNGTINYDDYAIFAKQWPDIPIGEPGIEYEITPCDMVMSVAEQTDGTRFTVTVEGRRILFEDMMVANCCTPLQNLWLEMTVNGILITIYENEELPQYPCLCICDYPITATLGPFEPGTYTIEVYQEEGYGGFIGSAVVIIE
jgi:hypothetical protein